MKTNIIKPMTPRLSNINLNELIKNWRMKAPYRHRHRHHNPSKEAKLMEFHFLPAQMTSIQPMLHCFGMAAVHLTLPPKTLLPLPPHMHLKPYLVPQLLQLHLNQIDYTFNSNHLESYKHACNAPNSAFNTSEKSSDQHIVHWQKFNLPNW